MHYINLRFTYFYFTYNFTKTLILPLAPSLTRSYRPSIDTVTDGRICDVKMQVFLTFNFF